MSSIHPINLKNIDGDDLPLSSFSGKALLIVNVASACGLTPQYEGLQALYEKYQGQGLEILGCPCNQFGAQEPGSESEIKEFCSTKFSVTFPMSSKLEVNGDGRHELYQNLAGDDAKFPGDITWNFEKFLIDKEGNVVQRFSPKTTPDDAEVVSAIEAQL